MIVTGKSKSQIVAEACAEVGIAVDIAVGPSRRMVDTTARHHVMWILRDRHDWSLHQIGDALGFRDHTTALHGIRKYAKENELEHRLPFHGYTLLNSLRMQRARELGRDIIDLGRGANG